MIPRLPPKQLMVDSLLEERRRGLQRWLRIVSKHPTLSVDPLFIAFLSDSSADHQEHVRDLAAREPDEFAQLSETVTLPLEDQGRLAASRETMRSMLGAASRLKRLADQQAARTQAQAKDVAEMSTILRQAGEAAACTDIARGFADVAALSERCAQQQQTAIGERFEVLMEVLVSHSDLCDRVEKGIVAEHQRAMSKMLTLNRQRMKGVIRGTAVSGGDSPCNAMCT